jgi:proteasome lid subunit RPN8/RPN11
MAVTADFREIGLKDLPKADFPARMREEYRVHIKREAFERMMAHARTTDEVELCGVLIGQVVRDEQCPFLKITAVIEGEKANNYGAQVTFTQQTWNHINEVRDREYPKDRVIGWYHTHPGFGVFLSGMDTFIQENFFNLPYQVAIVIETKQDKLGCFVWKDGKSTPLTRMWVGETEMPLAGGTADGFDAARAGADDKPAPAAPVASGIPSTYPEDTSPFRYTFVIVIGLLMLVLGFQWGRGNTYHDLRQFGLDTLESEVYGLLEFAAVSQIAAQDMAQAREKLTAARKLIESGDMTAARAGLDQLAADLGTLEKTYQRPRSDYRQQLEKLADRRQLFSERLDKIQDIQREQNLCLANMYMMQLSTVLKVTGSNPEELASLSEQNKAGLRGLIETILRLCPEAKPRIEALYPALLKALYPSSEQTEPKEPPKPGGENKT